MVSSWIFTLQITLLAKAFDYVGRCLRLWLQFLSLFIYEGFVQIEHDLQVLAMHMMWVFNLL